MRILLTGASGLVGGCFLRELSSAHEVVGTCCKHRGDGLLPLDITDRDAVAKVIREGGFSHIISNAAIRSPDDCLDDPEEAYRVNGVAVEHLAASARDAGAMLVQISTDYVFDGDAAPYREEDMPRPVNVYGRSKVAGEYAARTVAKHLIVRIPIQWRMDLTDPRNAATEVATWLHAGEQRSLDAETVRYYTNSEDVARAVRFLLENEVTGVIHLSAQERSTKADFAKKLCAHLGLDPAQVVDAPPPTTGDVRPHNSHLDTSRYESMGGPVLRGPSDYFADVSD